MRGPRAWMAEFIGTLTFVTIAAGSVIVTNAGLAPLGVFGVAAANGLALAVAITAFENASGGYLNPAVTISVWIGGRIRHADAAAYVVAQVLGSVAAGGLLIGMFGRFADATNAGTPGPRAGFPMGRAILVEAVFTFFLSLVMWATVVDDRGRRVAGFAVGMTLFASMLVTAQVTGGALNPARHIGPALVAGYLRNWWLFWVGPVMGGIAAGLLYPILLLDRRFPWRLVPASLPPESPPSRRTPRR